MTDTEIEQHQHSETNVAQGSETSEAFTYVGFWMRVLASLIDTVALLAVIAPILYAVYGESYFTSMTPPTGIVHYLLNYMLPIVVILLFWIYKSATPGKMIIGAKIVDASSGGVPAKKKLIIRYVGYYISMLPLLLGFFWVALDSRKQGFHDKLAGTVVVKERNNVVK